MEVLDQSKVEPRTTKQLGRESQVIFLTVAEEIVLGYLNSPPCVLFSPWSAKYQEMIVMEGITVQDFTTCVRGRDREEA